MKLIIEIDMKGEAFEGDCAGPEVWRILHTQKDLSWLGRWEFNAIASAPISLRDINGNICGSVKVEE